MPVGAAAPDGAIYVPIEGCQWSWKVTFAIAIMTLRVGFYDDACAAVTIDGTGTTGPGDGVFSPITVMPEWSGTQGPPAL